MLSVQACKVNLKNTTREYLRYIGLFLVSVLCGCGSKYTPGEGFSVMGELYNSRGKQMNNCTIRLLNQEGNVLDGPDNIPGKFHKIFVVSSNKTNYVVDILCPGYKTHQNHVTYGEDVTPITPLKLGEVTMKSLYE